MSDGAALPERRTPGVTELLTSWCAGDESALAQLTPLVHDELHRLAHRQMRNERGGHTLQTTAVVNEAYLKLVDLTRVRWQDRAHFFAMAARLMRHILVDYARSHASAKRGGEVFSVSLDEAAVVSAEPSADLVALDDAMHALSALDARKSQVVEMRFFGGLTVQETAEALDVSPETVMRDWQFAKKWLQRELMRERRTLSADRFAEVERLYHEATLRRPEERAAFLDQACGGDDALRHEVESLLSLPTDAGEFLSRTALEEAARAGHRPWEPHSWPTIPGYTVRRVLGEGGMGVVYLAEQETPLRRLVALKLIKPGMDTRQVVARFETERQALALMDHPNIAAVFDAGSTDERAAVLRHGVRRRRRHHRLLRSRAPLDARSAGVVRAGVRGRPARAPEGRHPSRPEAIERARRRAGWPRAAEGHRFWNREGRRRGRGTQPRRKAVRAWSSERSST